MRARIAQLEDDLKLWQAAYRHLAEAMAKPLDQPWPYVPPTLPRPELPPHFVAYACSFPTTGQQNAPTSTTVTMTSKPSKGDEP